MAADGKPKRLHLVLQVGLRRILRRRRQRWIIARRPPSVQPPQEARPAEAPADLVEHAGLDQTAALLGLSPDPVQEVLQGIKWAGACALRYHLIDQPARDALDLHQPDANTSGDTRIMPVTIIDIRGT